MAKAKKATAETEAETVTTTNVPEGAEPVIVQAPEPEPDPVIINGNTSTPIQEDAQTPSIPIGELPLPYTGVVAAEAAWVQSSAGPTGHTVGILKKWTPVTIIDRSEGYARMSNGLWVKESLLQA